MTKTLNMAISPVHRLRNRNADAGYRNYVFGSYTAQPNRPAVYYVEYRAVRFVDHADNLVRLGHKGWFTDDDFQEDVMRGVVCALPARDGQRRLVAGYEYTGGDDSGATLFFDQLFDDEKDAARMADEHARVAAESEREYQAEERAKAEAEEAEEARLDNLAACHPPLHVE